MTKVKTTGAVQRELQRRLSARNEITKSFSLADFCFDKQLAFLQDPARFKTAVCSRRAGKSVACAADLLNTALNQQGDVAYITLNRRTAKRIIWRQLLDINKAYKIGAIPDKTELTLTLPNGNIIYVSGAKDESDIEKFRGLALRKVYIDECQSFRGYIEELVQDILEPSLTDYYGSLILIGTPGPIPGGFFYESAHNDSWSHHAWTLHDNPWIAKKSGKDPEDIITELCARRGVSKSHASILREYYGKWIKDVDSLVFKFDNTLNVYLQPPKDLVYVFGIDIGWKDSDAIAVLGYSESEKKVYLIEEWVENKQNISQLVHKIKELNAIYQPVKMVMDAGALGKKIQEEIRQRHALNVDAAEKTRKLEFISLLNDDLRTGKFQAFSGSRFEEDSYLLQWDYSDPAKPKIADSYHTDIGDAVLYAWRECKHFFSEPEPVKPNIDEYMKQLEEREAQAVEDKKSGISELTDVQSWEDLYVTDDYSDDFF